MLGKVSAHFEPSFVVFKQRLKEIKPLPSLFVKEVTSI